MNFKKQFLEFHEQTIKYLWCFSSYFLENVSINFVYLLYPNKKIILVNKIFSNTHTVHYLFIIHVFFSIELKLESPYTSRQFDTLITRSVELQKDNIIKVNEEILRSISFQHACDVNVKLKLDAYKVIGKRIFLLNL